MVQTHQVTKNSLPNSTHTNSSSQSDDNSQDNQLLIHKTQQLDSTDGTKQKGQFNGHETKPRGGTKPKAE